MGPQYKKGGEWLFTACVTFSCKGSATYFRGKVCVRQGWAVPSCFTSWTVQNQTNMIVNNLFNVYMAVHLFDVYMAISREQPVQLVNASAPVRRVHGSQS